MYALETTFKITITLGMILAFTGVSLLVAGGLLGNHRLMDFSAFLVLPGMALLLLALIIIALLFVWDF